MPDGGTVNLYQLDLAQLEPFLSRVIVVAECYEGTFVACGFGEAPRTYTELQPQIHVVPNDIDALSGLIDAFKTINSTPGLNAYLSIGLFKPRDQWRNPRGRGREDDLIGTLAFVGDFDRGHDPATCLDRVPLAPQFVVETSAGNYQTWLLLDRPYPAGEAKPLFAALTRAMGSDDTFSGEHIFRPPGTWNWPTEEKGDCRGGRWARPLARAAARPAGDAMIPLVYSLADLRAATLLKYPHAFDTANAASAGSDDASHDDGDFDWHRPATTPRGAIDPEYFTRRLGKEGDRSAIVASVIERCRRSGWTAEQTFAALNANEDAPVMDHYGGDESRVRADIERLWRKPDRP